MRTSARRHHRPRGGKAESAPRAGADRAEVSDRDSAADGLLRR
jgi:hypothetical protein